MSFEQLPELPEMLSYPLSGAYRKRAVALSYQAFRDTRNVTDVAYSDSSYWHKVDFYMPDDESLTGLPVMCFMHGGAWRNGCKEWMGFIAPAVTRTPAVFVSFDYRLAPDAKMPQIIGDCADALAHVYKTVEQYGGDPERIFIAGHSAGAHLSSYLTLNPDLMVERGCPDNVIKACMPSGGIYEIDFAQMGNPDNPWMETAYPMAFEDINDTELASDLSPLNHVKGNKVPFHVSWGETDVPEVLRTTDRFVEALANENCVLETYMWPYLDHYDLNIEQGHESGPWILKMREWMNELPKV